MFGKEMSYNRTGLSRGWFEATGDDWRSGWLCVLIVRPVDIVEDYFSYWMKYVRVVLKRALNSKAHDS
jgi:hypothetical protein